MKIRFLLILSILSTAIAPNLNASTNWTVYLRQAGPLRIGMSLVEVRKLIKDPKAFLAYGSADPEPDDSECAYLQSVRIPEHLGLMFQNARLVRIDVHEQGIRTASGAQIGDGEVRIKKLYPHRIRVEQHPYLGESGHYLIYLALGKSDRGYGMVFETADGIVTSFRIGTLEAIALIEGCS